MRSNVGPRNPGDLAATLITSDWTEALIANTPMPSFDTTIIGTVPAAKVLGKHFVSIDVTAPVVAIPRIPRIPRLKFVFLARGAPLSPFAPVKSLLIRPHFPATKFFCLLPIRLN